MSFRKLLLLIAVTAVALASCKKDEETTTMKPYLSGSVSFDIDAFVLAEQTVTLTPDGLSHPDGKGIGYYWKVTPGMDKADTTRLENGLSPDNKESDGSFTYRFKDTLATFTVSCTGFADGYNTSYASSYVTTVKPGIDGTISGTGIKKEDAKVYYRGVDYYYTEINGLKWMRINLANNSYGTPYGSYKAMTEVLGVYYSHEDAEKACPDGWTLPTDKQWRELGAYLNGSPAVDEYMTIPGVAASMMGDIQFNGETMWEYWPAVGEITNKSKLAMIPAGYVNLGEKKDNKYPDAQYTGIDEYAIFWTADKTEDGMAYYRYINVKQPDMFVGKGDRKTFGANVRCVQNVK